MPRIGFVLIGGRHQLLHVLPVAATLSRNDSVDLRLYAATDALAADALSLFRRLGGARTRVHVMRLPRPIEAISRADANGVSLKLPRLLWWIPELRCCDVLVAAERTSTVLTRLPGAVPPMVHIRHGAGDRAVGFESRISRFDQLIVAGEKDRQRTITAGLLPPHRIHACGYLKFAGIRQLHRESIPLFSNGRPTVLYNPHFDSRLGSWSQHGRALIDAIRASGRFNLIVAPHTRLFAGASAPERQAWESLQVPGECIVDLGSTRSIDMTYTTAADIYLGDVSSQVYEFVARPRPCLFVNAHDIAWQNNPDYRMWKMGEVVPDAARILPALERALARHGEYLPVQQAFVAETLGDMQTDGSEHAARIILDCVKRRAAGPVPDLRAYPRRSRHGHP